jgi:hypothetical protein
MARRLLLLSLLMALGCDANVVDAVREPAPPQPTSSQSPQPPSLLEVSLIHRYSFDGKGSLVRDSKGAARGSLVGTELVGKDQLTLAGERSGQYVDLPNGLVSGLQDATFEAWLTWDGGGFWQRIFDFGSSSAGEDAAGVTGVSYLFLTTSSSPDAPDKPTGTPRLVYSLNGVDDEEVCIAPNAFPIGTPTQVVAVIDRGRRRMTLYQDGERLVDCALKRPLSEIDDVNNWLGHSNYVADVDLSATFDEFRIYGAALAASDVAASFAAGPDAGR